MADPYGLMAARTQQPTPYAATNAPMGNAPMGAGSFGEWAGGLMSNPNFAAGLSILGTQPGGNWGPAGAQAAQGAMQGQLRQAAAQRQQAEHQRLQSQRGQMDRIWQEAFPGGQANPNHPLTKGMPPEMLASVYAMGPEQGLGLLGKYAMTKSTAAAEMQQRMQLERMKMDLQRQQQQAQMQALQQVFRRGHGGQTQGQMPPQEAPQGVPGGQPDPFAEPAAVMGGEAPMAPMMPPQMAAAQAAAQTAPQDGMPPIIDTPGVQESMMGNLLLGDTKGAFNAFDAEVGRRREAEIRTAQGRQKQQAELQAKRPQARLTLGSSLDSLERLEAEATAIRDDKALPEITGLAGYFPAIPGTPRTDLIERTETLRSQVGLGVLQAMREASKTGGALGNVSDAEGRRLESNLAALATRQSDQAYKRSLNQIISYAKRARERMQGAYRETYGEDFGGGQSGPTVFPTRPETKKLGKKTYVKIDGQWFEE